MCKQVDVMVFNLVLSLLPNDLQLVHDLVIGYKASVVLKGLFCVFMCFIALMKCLYLNARTNAVKQHSI